MAFLIDITDKKFKIPANRVIIEFIRDANPFAHSDVGSKLIAVGKAIAGAKTYCPNFRECAYVVLHDNAEVIFAIAFGMYSIGLLLPPGAAAEVRNNSAPGAAIGNDWLSIDLFDQRRSVTIEALSRWSAAACQFAQQRGAGPPA